MLFQPIVSVLMTTYKNDKFDLLRAVRSILNQTLREIELILVFEPRDPNCTAFRSEIKDPRLVVLEMEIQLGRSGCYNAGLRVARGKYLARMDADDWSAPARLEKQVAYLEANPGVAVVGTAMELADAASESSAIRNYPTNHDQIMRRMSFSNALGHPTVMWNRVIVASDEYYDADFSRFCDDLEFWLRLAEHGHRFANLTEPLLIYRLVANGTRPQENWRMNYKARAKHWRLIGRYPAMLIGLTAMAILQFLPSTVRDFLTGSGRLSELQGVSRSVPPVEIKD